MGVDVMLDVREVPARDNILFGWHAADDAGASLILGTCIRSS